MSSSDWPEQPTPGPELYNKGTQTGRNVKPKHSKCSRCGGNILDQGHQTCFFNALYQAQADIQGLYGKGESGIKIRRLYHLANKLSRDSDDIYQRKKYGNAEQYGKYDLEGKPYDRKPSF